MPSAAAAVADRIRSRDGGRRYAAMTMGDPRADLAEEHRRHLEEALTRASDDLIAANDTVRRLEAAERTLHGEVAQRADALTAAGVRIAALEAALADEHAARLASDAERAAIHDTHVWRAVMRYRSLRDRVLAVRRTGSA